MRLVTITCCVAALGVLLVGCTGAASSASTTHSVVRAVLPGSSVTLKQRSAAHNPGGVGGHAEGRLGSKRPSAGR